MNGYAFWTHLSIVILLVGAPLVFLWFLGDALDLLRGLGRMEPEAREDDEAAGGDGRHRNQTGTPGL